MSTTKKSLLTILSLILATTAALAAIGMRGSATAPPLAAPTLTGDERVTVSTEVVQDKVLKGGDGRVTVSLNLTAARLPLIDSDPVPAADLVIVLDRSGSMEGQKLSDVRQAVIGLLDQLEQDDRLALVTYSNGVQTQSALAPMNEANRRRLTAVVERVHAGGGTNLGGGLKRGMDLLMQTTGTLRQRKVILISDGLANQGITDPDALGRIASAAVENRFSISTVGVGLEFNEMLMTAIADQGAGHYTFLEDPRVFAQVFESEFQATRHVAAADVNIRIPLEPGVRLEAAGGYPIRHEEGSAIIHPGNLLSGQSKTLYLTFQVPTTEEKEIVMGRVQVRYRHNDQTSTVDAARPLTVACVPDPAAVMASIKKDIWADQVVQESFSRLKEAVAADIRDGDPTRAQARIHEYEAKQEAINSAVGSAKVAENLETDVQALRQQVDETFSGTPAAVAEKRKQVSKALQYDGYKIRRDKK
ncbi:VWA domain-containing protein [Desulfosarcina sp.]|uniref:vWA domain-containing protein n=1 Tax=Desulfosarcina sp. TaxID=2027861 RepID=UPI0035661F9C